MAQGIFGPFETNVTLAALDCVKIGIIAMKEKNYVSAIEWLQLGLDLCDSAAINRDKKLRNILRRKLIIAELLVLTYGKMCFVHMHSRNYFIHITF